MNEDEILASAPPGKQWAVRIIKNNHNGFPPSTALILKMARDALGIPSSKSAQATTPGEN